MTPPGQPPRPRRVRLRLSAALLALAAGVAALTFATLLVRSALADGDPASDTLLGVNVFFPYSPPVSAQLERALTVETTTAKRAGFPIKVALIQSPTDLGAIPSLFGKPQEYATFLDQEISLIGVAHPPLLVVMPDGYGTAGLPPAATRAAATLADPPASLRSDGLAQAAITAVAKMADAAGHPIKAPSTAAGTGQGGGQSGERSPILLAAIIAALALAAAALTAWRRGLLRSRGRR